MSRVRIDCGPDLDLALRALGGDGDAWRRIVDETCDRLFAFLCYQTGDRDEALDLMQETYLAAFKKLRSYRGDAPIGAWLRVIALRKAIDWKRTALRRIRRTVALRETIVSNAPAPDRHARFESERRRLYDALARLSRMQRAAFLLREWEMMSFAEIAEVIGCKESVARVHYVRARDRLRGMNLAG
jgi:RNA polymerase sigma factor (sigma-70 family)